MKIFQNKYCYCLVKKIVLVIVVASFINRYDAQNLVENASFETKSYCPGNFNQQELKILPGWWQPTDGTPDYFHTCSDKVGVPKNLFGVEPARQGEAYTGVVTYSASNRDYREYLQTKLSRPLAAGELVCIEMYLSAADYCSYVTDGFGIVLSKDKIKSNDEDVMAIKPALENPRLNMLDEAATWILISDIYKAFGGEEFLTIGNFRRDRDLKIIRRTEAVGAKGSNIWSYVYIDDISVKPIREKAECSCENEILASLAVDPPLELAEYNRIKLEAVLFDFDADILTEKALRQMDEVYILLKKNRAMYMEISGFTDIVGPDGYNMELSKRRAEKVIAYLSQKGIVDDRLRLTFFGKQNPVADNITEDGRHQNRRVEFQILEKKFELVQ